MNRLEQMVAETIVRDLPRLVQALQKIAGSLDVLNGLTEEEKKLIRVALSDRAMKYERQNNMKEADKCDELSEKF